MILLIYFYIDRTRLPSRESTADRPMKTKIISCLFTLILCQSASAAVNHINDHGFALENSFSTHAKPHQVWQALTQSVGQWWPADHTWFGDASKLSIDPVAGGCFCEIDGDRQAAHMRIGYVAPNKLLRMLGGLGPLQGMGLYGALDWKIEATFSGSKVNLTYNVGGYAKDGFAQLAPIVDRVQHQQLKALIDFLEK